MRTLVLKALMALLLAFTVVSPVVSLTRATEPAEFVQLIEYVYVENTVVGQLCVPPFEVVVDTLEVLRLEYTVIAHCSSIRLHVLLDDTLVQTTGWLGWPGAPPPFDVLPLSITVDLGPISGTHKIGLQAEGQVSGCNRGRLRSWGGRLAIATSKQPVMIDIQPGGYPNVIGVQKRGLLPVAILGSDTLDVTNIDPETIVLVVVGPATRGSPNAPELACSYEDINEDGYTDLIAFFSVPELISHGIFSLVSTSLTLAATLFDGTPIGGTDSVRLAFPPPWLA